MISGGAFQKKIVDPPAPGTLQTLLYVGPAPPGALQGTTAVDPVAPGGLHLSIPRLPERFMHNGFVDLPPPGTV